MKEIPIKKVIIKKLIMIIRTLIQKMIMIIFIEMTHYGNKRYIEYDLRNRSSIIIIL